MTAQIAIVRKSQNFRAMSNLHEFAAAKRQFSDDDDDSGSNEPPARLAKIEEESNKIHSLSELCVIPAERDDKIKLDLNVENEFVELIGEDLKKFSETGTKLMKDQLSEEEKNLYFTGMYQGLTECLMKKIPGGTETTRFKFCESLLFLISVLGLGALKRLNELSIAFSGGVSLKMSSLEKLRRTLLSRDGANSKQNLPASSAQNSICGELWPYVAPFFNLSSHIPNVAFAEDTRIEELRFRAGDKNTDKPQGDKVHVTFTHPIILRVSEFKMNYGFAGLRLSEDDVKKIKSALVPQLKFKGGSPAVLEISVCRNKDAVPYSGYSLNSSKLVNPTFMVASEGTLTLDQNVTRIRLYCNKITGFPQTNIGSVAIPRLVSFGTPNDGRTYDRAIDAEV